MNWTGAVRCTAIALLALSVACGTTDGQPTFETEDPSDATSSNATLISSATSIATSVAETTENDADEPTTSGPAGCTTTSDPGASSSTSLVATTSSSSVTTEPTTTTSTVESDPEIAARQTILDGLGYWLGEIDGAMGSRTSHAVTAFQKAEGLARTGRFDATTLERLSAAETPQARSGSGNMLEVDLQRQILLVVSDGTVRWIFDIATGAAATATPVGEFTIYNEIDGLRHAPLGTLYRPKYFNGGIAFHGYTSVPAEPASHGCVRLTYPAMDFVWEAGLAPLGSTVLVY